jgi:flagellin
MVTAGGAAGIAHSISLSGGSGTGATADIAYDDTGKVTGVTIRNAGTGYKAGDVLSMAANTTLTATVSTPTVSTALTAGNGTSTYSTIGLTFSSMVAGETVTVAGRTFVAKASASGTQVADAFVNGTTTYGDLSGTATWTAASAVGAATLFRDTTYGTTDTTAKSSSVRKAVTALDGIVVNTLGTQDVATNLLKMTGTINGQTTTQSVTVQAGAANTKQTLNFDSFGIQFDVSSYQDQDAKDIGYTLAALNTGSNPSTYGTTGQLIPGQVVVARGNNSNLKFQSGPTTDAFIEINTLNIQTASTGAYAGTSSEMMNLGTRTTASSAGNLGALGMNNTIDQWQTAFKNMADATDQALEYISTQRATYGSQINRISFTSTNLTAQSTNLQNSRSAIIDTDFAAETAKLTKGQIMQQAATAMLAQANQMPNVILSLLK